MPHKGTFMGRTLTLAINQTNQLNPPNTHRTPSCSEAALEVSLVAGSRVLPLYTLLYGASQVAIQKRLDAESTWETLKSIARSAAFIAFHIYTGSIIGCFLRNSFGRFYYRVLVCLPALSSSYLSLLIEKPSRRQALAFYVLNMAAEIIYRMAVTKGYFKPIRHGETLLFALSLAAWYHLLKSHGFGHDPVSAIVKLLIGRDEAKSRGKGSTTANGVKAAAESHQVAHRASDTKGLASFKSRASFIPDLLSGAVNFVGHKWLGDRHPSCPHSGPHATCLHYVVQPIPTRFLIGCSIQTLLKLSAKPMDLIRSPGATLRDTFLSRSSIRFGLFVATLVSSGRLTNCLLRRYSNSNEHQWHGAVAGLVAGTSMLWAPKSSISMYIMWKAIEQHFLLAARQGKIKHFDFSILTIYSLSAATILYTFALEPSLMRPSYMKFLDNVSDHRLHQLNRMVLDVFGTGSSIGYEDYFPDLDPKLMSNQFKELIFNWMIQPYE